MTAAGPGRDPPVLDWSDRSHWSHERKPCRYCGGLTNLRDSKRKPSHKVCAEEALARQAAEAAEAYGADTRLH